MPHLNFPSIGKVTENYQPLNSSLLKEVQINKREALWFSTNVFIVYSRWICFYYSITCNFPQTNNKPKHSFVSRTTRLWNLLPVACAIAWLNVREHLGFDLLGVVLHKKILHKHDFFVPAYLLSIFYTVYSPIDITYNYIWTIGWINWWTVFAIQFLVCYQPIGQLAFIFHK